MTAQILRPYQQSAVERIGKAWREGKRRLLMVLATGGGKTSIFSYVATQVAKRGGRTLVLCHRKELVYQARRRFQEFGVPTGLIMAGEPTNSSAPVQIATVQTLVRRKTPPADLVICDEAHLSTADTWQRILDAYPQARILGCTATPWRLAGKPLHGTYDELIVVATPRELREQGYLCDYHGFAYKAPSLEGVKKSGGDYNEADLANRVSDRGVVANIIEQWQAHASGLSTVVFAVTVAHSQQLCEEFKAAGVRAEHLDGATPAEQRKAILDRVNRGVTQVLCNVGVAVEGLDIPRLKCCILARPTASLARAIQMMGRVRRVWNGQIARIHDHAFVISQHGLPDADRDYALGAGELPDGVERPPSMSQCKQCLAVYESELGACPACGYEATASERELNLFGAEGLERVEFTGGEVAEAPRPKQVVEVSWPKPRVLEGIYRGWVEVDTQWGKARRHTLEAPRFTYSLHGKKRLNDLLEKVAVGSQVRVSYTGDQILPGGRSMKDFKVEVEKPDAEEDWAKLESVYKRLAEGVPLAEIPDPFV